jgi:pimeloyl-ACP methyl ester carboxylesterase
VEDEDAILEHFPAAQIATIANAGHWVHAEAREPFSELVIDFLKDLV